MRVIVERLSKTYRYRSGHDVVALEDVGITVEPEEFVAILGPSGCGKSTLLNVLAGLLPPTSGQVFFQGERQPDQPLTATVFQEFALFPWRTAEANVAFGLEELDIPAAERRAWVHRFIAMTGLEGFEAKYPHHMSIVADKGREWPGFPLVGIVVQKELYDAGLRSIPDLKGKRIGLTTLGSTLHYSLGNILEKAGLKLADVRVVPMQTLPGTIEALKGKQVDAILLPQPFPGTAEARASARSSSGRAIFTRGRRPPSSIRRDSPAIASGRSPS